MTKPGERCASSLTAARQEVEDAATVTLIEQRVAPAGIAASWKRRGR
jgi:hypothetical protein